MGLEPSRSKYCLREAWAVSSSSVGAAQRTVDFLADRLENSETIRGTTPCFTRKHDQYYLVLTTMRIWLVELDVKRQGVPGEVFWAEPFTAVAADKCKVGKWKNLLVLRRVSDGQVFQLVSVGTGPGSAGERFTEVAETLGRAPH